MTRTVFLNFFYGLLYHLTKKQHPLSNHYIMRVILTTFLRGDLLIIVPKGFLTKDSDNHFGD